jgi:CheY-like chemotaxis protein
MDQDTYNWAGEKFLIADDDTYSYLLLAKVLKNTGASLEFAVDGEQAVKKLRIDKSITAAILDIIMPKMNGVEVVKIIKKTRPDLIFIAYTADVVRFNAEKCKEYGFDFCISKPILPVRFLRILNEALALRGQLFEE